MNSRKNKKNPNTLAALTGAALALPAIAQLAHAATPPTSPEIGYRYSQYREDSVPTENLFTGSRERYDVNMHQFRLLAPVGDEWSMTVDGSYETMSGASAYGVTTNSAGQPQLIMSGASISEKRSAASVTARHFGERLSVSARLGYSDENDYTATSGAVEFEFDPSDRLTTWSGGIGYSHDNVEPVQKTGLLRILSDTRNSVTGFAALTRVLSAAWQVQAGVFAEQQDGYLSDPYRARDIRPDRRRQYGFTLRSRYFLKSVQAALHTDYRFYSDDWGIDAHTLELSWYQTVSHQLQLVPRLRYYSQSQADFYVESDDSNRTGYQSSDFRLSPFGALSAGLEIIYDEQHYRLSASVDRYESKGDWALGNVAVENPGLLSYTLMSVGVNYRF